MKLGSTIVTLRTKGISTNTVNKKPPQSKKLKIQISGEKLAAFWNSEDIVVADLFKNRQL